MNAPKGILTFAERYANCQATHPGCLIVMRLGDFYEIIGENARAAARAMDIALTKRGDVPMCGFPVANALPYLAVLGQMGKSVVCVDDSPKPRAPSDKPAGRRT